LGEPLGDDLGHAAFDLLVRHGNGDLGRLLVQATTGVRDRADRDPERLEELPHLPPLLCAHAGAPGGSLLYVRLPVSTRMCDKWGDGGGRPRAPPRPPASAASIPPPRPHRGG